MPEHVAADPDLKQRFEREAKTISSLNHPHICTLYDIGTQDGIDFLVMEYLDGETLAQRLEKGALPLDQALTIATQIADALDKAHRQGIVHRDLKPGNIMLTKAGAKLLDFGLAKLKPPEQAGALSALPTQPADLTQEGSILGTFQYMAPEQLEGQEADSRTDIFALGAVIYEMVTGRKAFEGKSQASLIGAILKDDPVPLTELQPVSPLVLQRLVSTCLAKAPEDRWQSARDLARELAWTKEGDATDEERSARVQGPMVPRRWMAATGLLGVVVALLAYAQFGSESAPSDARSSALVVSRTVIDLPTSAPLSVGTRVPLFGFESPPIALSPDGRQLVYVGRAENDTRLYHREMDSFDEPRPLAGTEGAIYAFFSPNGSEIGFLTNDRLKKTSTDGVTPIVVAPARSPTRASWVEGDRIYLFEDEGRTLSMVSAAGGERTELATVQGMFSDVLPDGKTALYSEGIDNISADYTGVLALGFEDLTMTPLLSSAYGARYLPTGHLLFARAGALVAVPFDAEEVAVTGAEVVVLRDVAVESLFPTIHAAISASGTLAYVQGGDLASGQLAWVNRHGEHAILDVPERVYGVLDVSPNEEQVIVEVADVDPYLWLWNLGSQSGQIFATGVSQPRWNPAGNLIAYRSGLPFDDTAGLVIQDARSGAHRELPVTDYQPGGWSQNDLITVERFGRAPMGVVSVETGELSVIAEPAALSAISPDGRYVTYSIQDEGRPEVWVQEIGGTFRQQISTDGGMETVWCDACNEVFYRNGNRVYGSQVALEPTPTFDPPTLVFQADEFIDTGGRSFDVSSDGVRLYYVRRTNPPDRSQIKVVSNWFEELKARVPTP